MPNTEGLLASRKWFIEERVKKVIDALQKNEIPAEYVPTASEACKRVLELIPPGARVAIGGSVTIRTMGLLEILRDKGHEVLDHWKPGLSPEEADQVRKSHLSSDVFLASSNAITLDGKLVNTDGSGNRVASMIAGPKRVIIVAGINKLVKDVNEALDRIRNRVAPMNCYRSSTPTPCAKTSLCVECHVPERQCRVTTIIEKRPKLAKDFRVIIVGEELGY